MQKDKTSTIKSILTTFEKVRLNYSVGGESLVGLETNDIHRYGPDITMYLLSFSIFKYLQLKLVLLRQGLFIRYQYKYDRFKIRRKYLWYSKNRFSDNKHVYLYRPKFNNNHICYKVRGKNIAFKNSDLNKSSINIFLNNDLELKVPNDLLVFIKRYKEILLSDKYEIYDINLSKGNEKKAIDLLSYVIEIINNNNYKYWLEGGTCLGAVRDGKIIPWDNDLDIGIEYDSDKKIKLLIKLLKKKFIIKIKDFPKGKDSWDLGKYRLLKVYKRKNYFFKDKICLDIFIFYRQKLSESNSSMVHKYVVYNKNGYHLSKYFDTLQTINFYSKTYNIPNFVEEWLENKYGESWRTPKRAWHVLLDDGTIMR